MRRCSWLLLGGCSIADVQPGDSAVSGLPVEEVGGLASVVRGLDEAPLPTSEVSLGSTTAEPDAGATAIFLDIPPGRAILEAHGEGLAPAFAPVDVPPHHLASAQLYPIAVESRTVDAAAGGAVALAIGTITFPAGALTLGGEPGTGDLALHVASLGPEESVAMPGDHQALVLDEIIEPIELFDAFYVAPADDAAWRIATPATVSVTLPAGSDAADAAVLAIYRFDASLRYWRHAGDASLEGDVVTGETASFGWLAVGSPAFRELACLVGQVERSGEPVPGAEILLTEAGRFGSRRATADEEGRYCIAATPEASATLRVWAIDQELVGRYGGSVDLEVGPSTGTCGGACIQARTIEISSVRSVSR